MESPSENRLLFYVSLAFVLLRMIVLQQYVTTNPFFAYPISDSELYMQWAESLLDGKTYFAQEYHHPPGYAFFLAPILWLSGSNLYAIVALQSFMIAVQSLILFYCTKRLFGARAAWVAFLLYSFCGPVVFYSMKILSETLYTTLVLASFLFLLRFCDRQKRSDIFACGLFLGLAMEVRGNATVLFWPALVAVLWYVKAWRERAWTAAILIAGVALFTVPVLIRNVSVAGAWTPIASNWGENFYFGNHPGATGGVPHVAGIRTNIFDQIQDVQSEASKRSGRAMTSLEAQRFWFREGVRFIFHEPARWLGLEWIKFRRMLQQLLPSGIYSYPLETRLYHPYFKLTIGYGLIFPLFIIGLAAMLWNRTTTIFLLYLGLQIFLLLLYWPEERYLLPVIPFLMIGAGCIARLSFPLSLAKGSVCAAALLLCLYVNLWPIRPGGVAAWYGNASSAHFSQQEFQQARILALEGTKIDANSLEAWTNLGSALYSEGHLHEAREAWFRAIEINPAHVMTLRNLAISYEAEDRKQSLIWWERALNAARAQSLPSETIEAIKKKIRETSP